MKQSALLSQRIARPSTDQLAALGIAVTHHWAGGCYCKETRIPAGMALEQHAHEHSHLSVLTAGRVQLETGRMSRFIAAPAVLTIAAGHAHRVVALEASTWLCIWRDDASTIAADPTINREG